LKYDDLLKKEASSKVEEG